MTEPPMPEPPMRERPPPGPPPPERAEAAEHWREIEALFEEARHLPPAERPAFLEARCSGAAALRSELERLLGAHDRSGAYLDRLDTDRAAALIDAVDDTGVAERAVGPYRVVRRLARGGMGVVYLAEDTRLGRRVALKVLPAHLSADPEAKRHFIQEARAASALDHPHVATLFEIDETEDGRLFIAMAYQAGETLRERIRRGPLPHEEARRLAIQIAEGLSAVHARGIVHRDIKPANVIVAGDGTARIVDFGIARMAGQPATRSGATRGTVAYMSPEQTRGGEVDRRTDLWSLGVVLYEMLTARRPFRGDSDSTVIHAIRHEEPGPLGGLRPGIPDSLAAVVERCLAKEPEARYPDADALLADLTLPEDGGAPAGSPRRHRGRGRVLVPVIAAAALAVVALIAGRILGGGGSASVHDDATAAGPVLAVLPFQVIGPEADLWRGGMVSLISANLDGVDGLRIIDPQVILARWDAEAKSSEGTLGAAAIGPILRATGASHALRGSLVGEGNSVRLTARIIDLDPGDEVGVYQAEGPADSILALADQVSVDVLRSMLAEAPGPSRQPGLARVITRSLPALKAFLAGESEYRRLRWAEAIPHYNEAVEHDPTFAIALYRLAMAHSWTGSGTLFREYSQRAAALSDRLSERERLLLSGQLRVTRSRASAIETFRRLVEAYPDYVEGWYGLGEAMAHLGGPWSLAEEARAFRRALELDPGYGPARYHLLEVAIATADTSAARELISRQESAAPGSPETIGFRLAGALAFGDSAARARAYAELDEAQESLGHVYFFLLKGPDQSASFAAVFRALPEGGRGMLIWRMSREGRFSEAREIKDRFFPDRAWQDAMWYLLGHPDPAGRDVARPVRERVAAGGSRTVWLRFLLGALAADAGNREAADSAASILLNPTLEGRTARDSLRARNTRSLGLLLRAYIAIRRGATVVPPELEAAIPGLNLIGPSTMGGQAHDLVRFTAGRMLQEQGDLAGARTQYEHLVSLDELGPPEVELYLAQVYDGLGNPDRAATLYDRFLRWTARADPEYASMRVEATETLRRLRRGGG